MGKGGSSNPNVAVVRRAVRSLGGTIVQVSGGRHLRITIRTKAGATFVMAVNQGKVDPFKQTGWVRQRYNKANASRKKKG